MPCFCSGCALSKRDGKELQSGQVSFLSEGTGNGKGTPGYFFPCHLQQGAAPGNHQRLRLQKPEYELPCTKVAFK